MEMFTFVFLKNGKGIRDKAKKYSINISIGKETNLYEHFHLTYVKSVAEPLAVNNKTLRLNQFDMSMLI